MEEISLKAQELFSIGGFSVTNSLVLTLMVSLVLISLALVSRRKIKMIPGVVQSAVEMGVEWLLDLMESILGSAKKAEQYLPLVATIFIFIFLSNMLGVLPGVGSFVYHEHTPLLRAPAADLNFTLAFAIISVFLTNFFGFITVGAVIYIKKFFNFSNPINFFVGILEFFSEFTRIISFSFRLFGNIFAGEVLLMIIFFLVPYIIPIPFLVLEMFFGTIQAFIFAMLTLVTLALHTTKPEHH